MEESAQGAPQHGNRSPATIEGLARELVAQAVKVARFAGQHSEEWRSQDYQPSRVGQAARARLALCGRAEQKALDDALDRLVQAERALTDAQSVATEEQWTHLVRVRDEARAAAREQAEKMPRNAVLRYDEALAALSVTEKALSIAKHERSQLPALYTKPRGPVLEALLQRGLVALNEDSHPTHIAEDAHLQQVAKVVVDELWSLSHAEKDAVRAMTEVAGPIINRAERLVAAEQIRAHCDGLEKCRAGFATAVEPLTLALKRRCPDGGRVFRAWRGASWCEVLLALTGEVLRRATDGPNGAELAAAGDALQDANIARLLLDLGIEVAKATATGRDGEERERPRWFPPNLEAAILVVLEEAGEAGLQDWSAVLHGVRRFGYDNDSGVRRHGKALVEAGFVELPGQHPTLRPTITSKGREHLQKLRNHAA